MGFIKDFYCNRLDPQSRCVPPGSKAAARADALSDKEQRLLEMLPEAEKSLFREIRELWQDTLADDSLDGCLTGFRYGARFSYDTFASSEAPYMDLEK